MSVWQYCTVGTRYDMVANCYSTITMLSVLTIRLNMISDIYIQSKWLGVWVFAYFIDVVSEMIIWYVTCICYDKLQNITCNLFVYRFELLSSQNYVAKLNGVGKCKSPWDLKVTSQGMRRLRTGQASHCHRLDRLRTMTQSMESWYIFSAWLSYQWMMLLNVYYHT